MFTMRALVRILSSGARRCQGRGVRFAVDTGGTFTDLVVEDDDGRLSIYKSSTVPSDPVQGILNVFERRRRGARPRREAAARRPASVLIHGTTRGAQRRAHRQHRAHRVPDHGRASRHPRCCARAAARTIFDLTQALPRAVRPARAHLRGARSGSAPAGEVRAAARRGRACARSSASCRDARRRGGRRSACCGRSSTRRTSCASASCSHEHLPGRPVHAVAPAQPVPARVPARVVDVHRRVAEADHDRRTSRSLEERLSDGRLRRPAPDRHLAGRRARRRGRRRGADPLAQLRARRWRRWPAATSPSADAAAEHGDRRRHRRHQLRRQPRAPRPHPVDARDLARPAVTSAT